MGTITARKRNDGSTGYTAQILRKRKGQIVHREARTFDRKQAASAWLKRRETELSEPGAIERAKTPDKTLATAIDRYITESRKTIGKTKAQVLASIKQHDIANTDCGEIRSQHIVDFANELLADGRQPSTVRNYISHLAAIFAVPGQHGATGLTKLKWRTLRRYFDGLVSSARANRAIGDRHSPNSTC